MRQVWYSENGKRRLEDMSSVVIAEEIQQSSRVRSKRNPRNTTGDSPNQSTKREERKMENSSETKRIQRTVFDLKEFDDVKLVKDVQLPNKPTELEEALHMAGNKDKLMEIIYKGLVAETTDKAWEDISGFKVADESGEPGEDYSGSFADETKGKLINAAILSLAKMQGYDKSLSKEKKRELKEKATEFLRSNPAMLQSIQG